MALTSDEAKQLKTLYGIDYGSPATASPAPINKQPTQPINGGNIISNLLGMIAPATKRYGSVVGSGINAGQDVSMLDSISKTSMEQSKKFIDLALKEKDPTKKKMFLDQSRKLDQNLSEVTNQFMNSKSRQTLQKNSTGNDLWDMLRIGGGAAAEAGSYFTPGVGGKGESMQFLAKNAEGEFLPEVGKGVLRGAIPAALSGALGGVASQQAKTPQDMLKAVLIGTKAGAAFGGAIGGAKEVISQGMKALAPLMIKMRASQLQPKENPAEFSKKTLDMGVKGNYGEMGKTANAELDALEGQYKNAQHVDVRVGDVFGNDPRKTEHAISTMESVQKYYENAGNFKKADEIKAILEKIGPVSSNNDKVLAQLQALGIGPEAIAGANFTKGTDILDKKLNTKELRTLRQAADTFGKSTFGKTGMGAAKAEGAATVGNTIREFLNHGNAVPNELKDINGKMQFWTNVRELSKAAQQHIDTKSPLSWFKMRAAIQAALVGGGYLMGGGGSLKYTLPVVASLGLWGAAENPETQQKVYNMAQGNSPLTQNAGSLIDFLTKRGAFAVGQNTK